MSGPLILVMGVVGTTLGLLAGTGSSWAGVIFLVYIVIALILLSVYVVKRRRSQGP